MKIKTGSIFESNAKTLVNTVNCVGVMGKGLALEFKKRYPQMFDEYVYLCSTGQVKPGQPYVWIDIEGNSVLQFPTKSHWRSPSQLQYIVDGLDWFCSHYTENNITSIAFPPLGCGNGGLSWEIVGPIMYDKLSALPIDITIYAPLGTSPEKITEEYLKRSIPTEINNTVKNQRDNFNRYWYLILYMIQRLNSDCYSLSVGRVIYQKICYVLTRTGIPTGFRFAKKSYGPFSADAKDALTVLSNANLISERQIGKMITIQVSPKFHFDSKIFSDDEMKRFYFCLDLMSRIKNTDQAEMVATVLYSYDDLLSAGKRPTEKEIGAYIESWKSHWGTAEKRDIVLSTIRELSELKWIKPDYSEASFEEDFT